MSGARFYTICIGLCVAVGAWGLYWIPQRSFEAGGLTAGWGTIGQYLMCFALLAPVAVWRLYNRLPTGLEMPLAGLLLGGGIVCYANSFLFTDVVRALLLFYMAPLWATIFEYVMLRKRPGWWRAVSLPISLLGVWIAIGQDAGIPLPENIGDWLAIVSGIMVAAGATRVEMLKIEGVFPIVFSFFACGTVFSVALLYLFLGDAGGMPSVDIWLDHIHWIFLLCVLFFLPSNALICWSPAQIGAGLFSILMLSELVVGTISAAIWANEPFGWPEGAGSSLIVIAGVLEVLLSRRSLVRPPA